jgi:hypothetical protein
MLNGSLVADTTEFSRQYSDALTDPAVIMAHAHVRRL